MQLLKSKSVFWVLAKLSMAVWRRWYRWKIRWWEVLFRIEATGSLVIFHCGKEVRIDAPVSVRGGRGTLEIGNNVWLGWDAAQKLGQGTILLQPRLAEAVITVGAHTQVSNNVTIVAMGKIDIGEHCLIGDMTSVIDCDFHEIEPSKRGEGVGPIEPVSIGDNVWIGSRVLILRGVSIGNNSVIGAGSIVTKSIPPNSLAAGIPARVLRKI
jgi:maltose O-acetyltransferase